MRVSGGGYRVHRTTDPLRIDAGPDIFSNLLTGWAQGADHAVRELQNPPRFIASARRGLLPVQDRLKSSDVTDWPAAIQGLGWAEIFNDRLLSENLWPQHAE